MEDFEAVQDRLTRLHVTLSPQLRRAAAYLLENPGDVATLSMRKVASNADVPLPNFDRLAKEIGFTTYGELREVYRKRVQSGGTIGYPERAQNLQSTGEARGAGATWAAFRDAAVANIKGAFDKVDASRISAVADELHRRQQIYLVGMQASQPFVRYLHYIGGMASPGLRIVGRDGAVLGDDLVDLGERDALICLAIRPCAKDTVQVAKLARQRGALVIGITDSRASPLAAHSDQVLLAPVESPSFFESYIGATAIIEMLIGFYVVGGGQSAIERIEKIEADRRRLGEYWDEGDGS